MIGVFRFVRGSSQVLLAGWLLLWTISITVAQDEIPQAVVIPFRRIFVPQNDILAIGVDDFVPIDVKLLDDLIRKHAATSQVEIAKRGASETSDNARLQSTFYVAKLIGADLVSERSYLTFLGDKLVADRLALAPWSLAVQPSNSNGTKPDAQLSPGWTFNERGEPRLAATFESTSQSERKDGHFESTFGWSAKADSASSPNKLKFSLEIPNCANSCLVLALPPQAEIQDSVTVVQRVADWSQIDRRLSSWSEFSKGVRQEASTGLNSESLWLIELGGSQTASFSISLGGDNRAQNAHPNSEGRRYEQLVRSQSLQHFIDGNEVRTLCDAEVFVSLLQPRLRLSLEAGAKLRRLTVNQINVDWNVEEGWIVATAVPAVLEPNSGNYVNVSAEFISSFAADHLGSIESANPSFDHSYVMSGSTVVQNSSPWRLTHVNCEASRIVQPVEDTKTSSVNRIEYSWSAQPPKLSFGLERTIPNRRCEALTRLSNDEMGTSAVIRAKLLFSEQDSSHAKVEIQKGWRLQSLSSMDPNDPISIQDEIETPSTREFQLAWDRIQKSRVAEIELRLFRDAVESVGQPRLIDCQAIFRLPGWHRTDTLVVEQDDLFHLDARDALLDQMISDDLVSEWQKPLLPKSNKGNLFRLDSHTVAQQLIWKKKSVLHRASSKTEIERSGVSTIRARHEIQLNMTSVRTETLAIAMPSKDVIWRWRDEDQWVPLTPLPSSPALTTGGNGLWLFDIRTLGPQPMLLAVVNSEFQEDSDVAFPVPKVSDFEMVSQVAQSLSSDVMLDCSEPSGVWTINDSGFKILELPANAGQVELSLSARVLRSNPFKKWFVDVCKLHVAVDTLGSQKASLILHSKAMSPSPVVIELENGWEPFAVRIQSSKGMIEIPFRIDGQRLVIPGQQVETDGSVEYEIDLAGPRLTRSHGILALGKSFSFQWPVFVVDGECATRQDHLWLPEELQLDEMKNNKLVGDSRWLLWGWSRRVFETVFGSSVTTDSTLSIANFPAMRALVPNWESTGLRLALEAPNRTEANTGRRDSVSKEPLRIGPLSPDRTLLALFFAVIILFTPRVMHLRYHVATWVCAGFIVLAHFAPAIVARFAFTGLIALFLGFLGAILYELLRNRLDNESSLSQRNSAKWSPWNDRQSENESGSNHLASRPVGGLRSNVIKMSSLGLLFITCATVANHSSPFGSVAFGQSKATDEKARVYQILLPIDDAGELVGSSAYVSQEMLNGLTDQGERTRGAERGTFPFSAKYSLRVGVRGRTDQLAMTYEFIVGEDLAPVRFPVNASQLQLPRFSVDGIELSLGNRLRSNGTFWTWTPDRPGRKTIQIIAQPIMKQVESDRNKDLLSQLLDVGIPPIANATIEIQTDPKNTVDIVSRGRVTDPEGGRFVAMLGAVDRLNCSIRTPMTKSNATATTAIDNGEVPTMNTELFLQNDILQAKTIVDFPRSHSFGSQVEMEADLQWQPVGGQWGDAQLVETRSGSNLFRRRYVLEWKTPSNSLGNNPLTSRDRQISVIWVPQTTTQSLNVLFAECLERGTRRGTLRFARSFPSWSIEGISTWIPAIGSKDRLDWPELKTNLLALSLRIPSNGGFGILKPKAIQDKPQQARITTKWSIEQNRESVSSMIAWFGSSPTSEPLVVELPDDYQVTELYNRNGPIRFLQSKGVGKIRLQILADRKFLDVSDLWIQARRQAELSEHDIDSRSQSLPWIELPTNIQSEQSLEILATERIALNFESEQTMLYGRGLSVPIQVMQKSTTDTQSSGQTASRIKLIHRDAQLAGTLQLKLDTNASPKELVVQAQLAISVASRPFFILEVPYSYKDRWQSEARIVSVPCPDENKAWLQIHLPEPTYTGDSTQVATTIRFSLRPEDSATGLEILKQIRALDIERIPSQLIDPAMQPDLNNRVARDVVIQADGEKNVARDSEPSIAMSMFQVRDDDFMPTQTKRFVLLESQYWFEKTENCVSKQRELEWQIADAVDVLCVEVNNKPVPFRQEGNRVRCAWIPSGLCSDVRVFSKHEVPATNHKNAVIDSPQLIGFIQQPAPLLFANSSVGVSQGGIAIPSTKSSEAIADITHICLDAMENSKWSWPKLDRVEPGSDFDEWRNHWTEKSLGYLEDWANNLDAVDQPEFGAAVTKWHSLKPLLGPSFQRKPSPRTSNYETLVSNSGLNLLSSKPQSSPWFSFFGCLMIVGAVTWLTSSIGSLLVDRPWWSYLTLGLFAWLVTGSLVPTLVLGTIGLVGAIDSYWMVTSRLRRNAIRGLR